MTSILRQSLIMWVDGSCFLPEIPHLRHAGTTVVFAKDCDLNFESKIGGQEQTSDRGEVEAVCAAIHSVDIPVEVWSDNECAANTFLRILSKPHDCHIFQKQLIDRPS